MQTSFIEQPKLRRRSSEKGCLFAKILALASMLALSGCLLPEKFTAVITFRGDGSYVYTYTGTANDYDRATDIPGSSADTPAYGAKLLDADDKRYLQPIERQAKANGAQKLEYLGNGRYHLTIVRQLQPFGTEAADETPGRTQFIKKIRAQDPMAKFPVEAQPVYGLVLVAKDSQGVVSVYDPSGLAEAAASNKLVDPLKLFGVDPSSKLEVRLPAGAKIIASNGKEGNFGELKTMSWTAAAARDQALNLQFMLR